METRINKFQQEELEYELERYPDIVPVVLKKMRMKTILEVTSERYPYVFRQIQIAKWQKYGKDLT